MAILILSCWLGTRLNRVGTRKKSKKNKKKRKKRKKSKEAFTGSKGDSQDDFLWATVFRRQLRGQ